MKIFLDNASTTPIDAAALDKWIEVAKNQYGNASSIHYFGRNAKAIIEEARKTFANAILASVGEIYFTSSATEANNMVLQRSIEDLGVNLIITSSIEHHCILHTCEYLENSKNIKVIYLPVNQEGEIALSTLEELLTSHRHCKILVSIQFTNNEIGTIQDVSKISEICDRYNVLFHCDAVQALGRQSIDVKATKFAFLTASAHKFYGAKGVGILYMNNENILQPFIYGGAQERNIRAGTENVPGIAAAAIALKNALTYQDERQKYIYNLRTYFESRLQNELFDIKVNAINARHRANHVSSISFPDTPKADMLLFNLDIAGISVSSGSACSAGIDVDSHVITAIGHPSERKTIRFSFSHLNTKEELDFVVEKLKTLTPVL